MTTENSNHVELQFVGDFDEAVTHSCNVCETTCDIVKSKVEEIKKFIAYGNRVGNFKTQVVCPETHITYIINFRPVV